MPAVRDVCPRLEPVDGQTLEKLPLILEISLYRRDKQTFAESTRTAKKVKDPVTDKTVDILRLVNVYKTSFPYRLEISLTDRISLLFHIFPPFFVSLCKSNKISPIFSDVPSILFKLQQKRPGYVTTGNLQHTSPLPFRASGAEREGGWLYCHKYPALTSPPPWC